MYLLCLNNHWVLSRLAEIWWRTQYQSWTFGPWLFSFRSLAVVERRLRIWGMQIWSDFPCPSKKRGICSFQIPFSPSRASHPLHSGTWLLLTPKRTWRDDHGSDLSKCLWILPSFFQILTEVSQPQQRWECYPNNWKQRHIPSTPLQWKVSIKPREMIALGRASIPACSLPLFRVSKWKFLWPCLLPTAWLRRWCLMGF